MAIRIPQVREQNLPATTGINAPGADAFGAGVGRALQQAGNTMETIAQDIQRRQNETKAREADTMYSRQVDTLTREYEQFNGKDALARKDEYLERLEAVRREAYDSLENDAQRHLFAPVVERKHTGTLDFMADQEIKATKDWEISELKAQNTMYMDEAVRSAGTDKGEEAMVAGFETIEDLGAAQGWSDDEIAVRKVEFQSKAFRGKIEGMVEKQPLAAKAFYEANKDKLTEDDRQKVAKQVEAYSEKARVFGEADRIMGAYQDDPVAALEAVKRLPADIRGQVRQEVEFQQRSIERAKNLAEEQNIEENWNLLRSNPRPTLRDIPPVAAVGAAAHARMSDYVTRQMQNNYVEIDDPQVVADLQYEMATNPEEFAKSDGPLAEAAAFLTGDTLRKFQDAQTKIRIGKATTDPKVGAALSEATAAANAVKLAELKPKSAEAAQFQQDVAVRIQQAAKEKGRDLTTTEMATVVNRAVYEKKNGARFDVNNVEVTVEDDFLWFDSKKKLSELTFQTTDGSSQWPQDLVANAAKKVVDLGRDITPANIQAVLDQWEQKGNLDTVTLP